MTTKVTKESVNYTEGIKERRCALCSMFLKPHACTLVKGWISPDDVCDKFDRRKKK